jgi:hypothetical protein
MAGNSLFRATALDRLSSPEQLDERLQIVPPRTWLAFAAIALVLLTGAAWSFFARIPLHLSGEGVFLSAPAESPREVAVFIPAADARQLRPGQSARIRITGTDDISGEVRAIAPQTTPRAQLLQLFDHAPTVDLLTRSGPVVRVTLDVRAPVDAPAGTRCTADLVVGEARPAALIFGR